MKTTALVGVFVLAVAHTASAQLTLTEITRQTRAPVSKTTNVYPTSVSLVELVNGSDLIVRGTIVETSSYLSPDGRDVNTDLRLESVSFVRPSEAVLTSQFGIPPHLTVT